MDDLPLEGGHRIERLGGTCPADLFRGNAPDLGKFRAAARTVTANVEHQPRPQTRLPVYSEPGQLLERLEYLAPRTNEFLKGRSDHRHDRPVAIDIHVDVTIQVCDVKQSLDVVSGYLPLLLEIHRIDLAGGLIPVRRHAIRRRKVAIASRGTAIPRGLLVRTGRAGGPQRGCTKPPHLVRQAHPITCRAADHVFRLAHDRNPPVKINLTQRLTSDRRA